MQGNASIGWVSDEPPATPTTRLKGELRKAEASHPLSNSARIEQLVADRVCKAILDNADLRKGLASGRVNKEGLVRTIKAAVLPHLQQAGVPDPTPGDRDDRSGWSSLAQRMQDDFAARSGQ